MSVLRSINMSVNVELVKIRTILELTGGKSIKPPANILSIVCSSMLEFENLLINGGVYKLLIQTPRQIVQNNSHIDIADQTFFWINVQEDCVLNIAKSLLPLRSKSCFLNLAYQKLYIYTKES